MSHQKLFRIAILILVSFVLIVPPADSNPAAQPPRSKSNIWPVLFIAVPLVVLIVFDIFPVQVKPGVYFKEETIEFTVAEDGNVNVKALYTFESGREIEEPVPIVYPFPQKDYLQPPQHVTISERVFNTFNEIEYQDNGTDWKFSIDLSHELPADIFVEYNQVTTENKFRYILTSANTWKEPLEEAEFLIKIPLKYELEKCSYRTKQLKSNDEFNLYLIEQRDFSPHKELTFSWVETGAN